MKKLLVLLELIMITALVGCAASTGTIPTSGASETLLWSSADARPAWTMDEPDTDGEIMSFVGLSARHATEKGAREDARRNTTDAVVKYMGTMVKNKFEALSVSFGLDSSVIDPTKSAKEYEKQLSANMASKVKIKSWYLEKWQTATGIGYKAFALGKVPMSAVDDSLKSMSKNKAREAEKKAREAADDQAKDQANKAAEFWKQMQEQGVVE